MGECFNTKSVIFYIVLFLFILAFSTTAGNYDYDLWAKLIVGMAVAQTGHVPKQDFLSYIPTHAWFDHEWGCGVVFYFVHHFFSNAGIILLQAILIFLTFFFITKIVKLRGVKTTSAYNFLFYYLAFMSISYILNAPIRCQLFTFLFFTIFLYLFERYRLGKGKVPDLIIYPPIIMVFWYNLHGGCLAGPGLIFLYIIGEFLNHKSINELRPYIYSLIACIIVFPINPWGFEFFKLVLVSNFISHSLISDWSGLFTNQTPLIYNRFKIFALILLSTELGVIIKQLLSKTFNFDKTKFLILAATLFIAIQHIKMIPFAVISISCFCYDDFYTAFNFLTKNFFNQISILKDSAIYVLVLIFAFTTIKVNGFSPYLDWSRYPVRAVEFIRINKLKGNLLVDFSFGDYASYKLYPNNKIFMDGRYEEVYDVNMLKVLGYFHVGGRNWNNLLIKFPPNVILLEKRYPIYKILKNEKNWKQVFDDNLFAVFVKPEGIKKYKNPSDDINYYKKTLFDTEIKFGEKSERKS